MQALFGSDESSFAVTKKQFLDSSPELSPEFSRTAAAASGGSWQKSLRDFRVGATEGDRQVSGTDFKDFSRKFPKFAFQPQGQGAGAMGAKSEGARERLGGPAAEVSAF